MDISNPEVHIMRRIIVTLISLALLFIIGFAIMLKVPDHR